MSWLVSNPSGSCFVFYAHHFFSSIEHHEVTELYATLLGNFLLYDYIQPTEYANQTALLRSFREEMLGLSLERCDILAEFSAKSYLRPCAKRRRSALFCGGEPLGGGAGG